MAFIISSLSGSVLGFKPSAQTPAMQMTPKTIAMNVVNLVPGPINSAIWPLKLAKAKKATPASKDNFCLVFKMFPQEE